MATTEERLAALEAENERQKAQLTDLVDQIQLTAGHTSDFQTEALAERAKLDKKIQSVNITAHVNKKGNGILKKVILDLKRRFKENAASKNDQHQFLTSSIETLKSDMTDLRADVADLEKSKEEIRVNAARVEGREEMRARTEMTGKLTHNADDDEMSPMAAAKVVLKGYIPSKVVLKILGVIGALVAIIGLLIKALLG